MHPDWVFWSGGKVGGGIGDELQVPTQWRQVGKLASLTVFPLKSGRGIPLKEGECTEIGLKTLGQGAAHLRDRFFVIYGDKYFDHKNAKTYPKMVLINISSEKEGEVKFEAPGMPALRLQVPDHANKLNDKYCLLWLNDKVKTLDCGEEVASWMSRYILDKESGVRLGYHLEHVTQRNAYKPPWSAFRVFYDKLRTKDIKRARGDTRLLLTKQQTNRNRSPTNSRFQLVVSQFKKSQELLHMTQRLLQGDNDALNILCLATRVWSGNRDSVSGFAFVDLVRNVHQQIPASPSSQQRIKIQQKVLDKGFLTKIEPYQLSSMTKFTIHGKETDPQPVLNQVMQQHKELRTKN
uniref:(California timema) hypothetical protein n=1 Tax=Timema californicum TaxID=61474 RepID=A0A7R9PAK5_TIMCA|nr:unnamed protein product [Timema californicum]